MFVFPLVLIYTYFLSVLHVISHVAPTETGDRRRRYRWTMVKGKYDGKNDGGGGESKLRSLSRPLLSFYTSARGLRFTRNIVINEIFLTFHRPIGQGVCVFISIPVGRDYRGVRFQLAFAWYFRRTDTGTRQVGFEPFVR